jgi:TldD protein
MSVTRREFVLTGGAAALAACAPQIAVPPRGALTDAKLEEVVGRALDAAKRAGASYADVRIVRRRRELARTRDESIADLVDDESYGVGVRVIVDGAWGFAATSHVEGNNAAKCAERAAAIARANSKVKEAPIALAPVATYRGKWQTKLRIDPFAVPLAEKVDLLLSLWRDAHAVPEVKHATGTIESDGEWKLFGSSDGTLVEQSITRVQAGLDVTAIDGGEFITRRSEVAPRQAGWEHVVESSLRHGARKMAEDAVQKLKSASVEPGKRDLILAPSHLWLTIHESVGHPTELDRALGYEANFAGTSFATVDKLGKLQYAAHDVSIFADKTTPGALATCAWDDDGEETQRWDIVKDGLFVGYQTTREQAGWIGEKRSRGTSYADSFASFPFQRMPNVSLAPGKKPMSLDDMIAATDDAILITGDGSWSIDHQRYNFQFGGQMFYEIKSGKIARTLRDVAYQSNSLDFWRSLDMLGGEASWDLFGSMSDGKGEPQQSNAVSHGCPPARFRQVNVLNTRAQAQRKPA